jgi:hypothetical protein
MTYMSTPICERFYSTVCSSTHCASRLFEHQQTCPAFESRLDETKSAESISFPFPIAVIIHSSYIHTHVIMTSVKLTHWILVVLVFTLIETVRGQYQVNGQ